MSWVQRGDDFDTAGIVGDSGGTNLGVNEYPVHINGNGTAVIIATPQEKGMVKVFIWKGTFWSQRGDDLVDDPVIVSTFSASGRFGSGVAIDDTGKRIVVGAPLGSSAAGQHFYGRVSAFDWNGSSWNRVGSVIYGVYTEGIGYKTAISRDGNTIAFSSIEIAGPTTAKVKVFDFVDTDWVQRGNSILTTDRINSFDMNANGTNIIYSESDNDDAATNAGRVIVFVWNGSSWVQRGAALLGTEANENFGRNVAMSDDGTIIAAATTNGKCRVYAWNGVQWRQRGNQVTSGNSSYGDCDLNSDGTILAHGDVTTNGTIKVYQWQYGAWAVLGGVITGTANDTKLGSSISLDSNGTVVAIGAVLHDPVDEDDTALVYKYGLADELKVPQSAVDNNTPPIQVQSVRVATQRDRHVSRHTTLSDTTAESKILLEAGVGVYLNVTHMTFSNSDTDTTPRVDVRNVEGGDVVLSVKVPSGQPLVIPFPQPFLQPTSNEPWTAQCSAATSDVNITVMALRETITD
jgi:hypothetical protein